MHPSDFDTLLTTHNGITRTVYRKGMGPIVVILPEIPGLHTSTFELARKIAEHGFSVYLLSLFGEDNKSFRYRDAITKIGHVCINRENLPFWQVIEAVLSWTGYVLFVVQYKAKIFRYWTDWHVYNGKFCLRIASRTVDVGSCSVTTIPSNGQTFWLACRPYYS